MSQRAIGKREKTAVWGLCAASFFLCFFCAAVIFATGGVTFGGPKSVLISDMRQQYIDFYMALRGGLTAYSNGLALGGDFLGTFAYYLASPLSWLVCLFPKMLLQQALLFLILLKASLGAAAFSWMLYKTGMGRGAVAVAFSLCYALMSFLFYFFINLFWLDAFIWLPIIAALIIRMLRGESGTALPFCLAALFISNFYIAYITGLFLVLFTLYCAAQLGLGFRALWKAFVKLAGSALLAALFSSALLLPAAKGYVAQMGVEVYNGYGEVNFTARQFILKLLVGHFDSIGNACAPTIFCGTLVLLLVVVFFFVRAISLREKLTALGILGFMLISFYLPSLDVIWHAFAYPNAFAYRYAFCFSFFLIFLAARALAHIRECPRLVLLALFAVPLSIVLAYRYLIAYAWFHSIAATALGSLLSVVLLLALRANGQRRSLALALLAAVILELGANGALNLHGVDIQNGLPALAEWQTERQTKLELLGGADHAGYRVADTREQTFNEGVALGYSGVSGFSSFFSPELQRFYRQVGYGGFYKTYRYQVNSLFVDSFLGVKYVLSPDDISYMQTVARSGDTALCENDMALPIAFCVPEDFLNVQLSDGDVAGNIARLRLAAAPGSADDEEALGMLAAHALDTRIYEQGRFAGGIDVPEGAVVLFTVPVDGEFTALVDGVRAEIIKAPGELTGVRVPEGAHDVELRYRPRLLMMGAAISGISCAAYSVWLALRRRKGGRPARG